MVIVIPSDGLWILLALMAGAAIATQFIEDGPARKQRRIARKYRRTRR